MSNYRKKMFRGAKIEDCILDFIYMEKELKRVIDTSDADKKVLLSGMSKAYRMIVNRLVREFDYSKGGVIINLKLTDLINSLKKRTIELANKSKEKSENSIHKTYYEEIPEKAGNELNDIPDDFKKGLFEGMSIGYEKIMIDLELLLISDDNDKMVFLERVVEKYQKLTKMIKSNFDKKELDYKSGYFQGEISAYQMVEEEIKVIFTIEY
ncbi:hypothetical protein ACV242_005499 [Peribacillus simplex]